MKKNIKLYKGDCLDVMKKMADKSVDLILTDPPYGIGLKYNSYDDSESNWYELMEKALPEICRIAKMAILPSCKIHRLKWIYDHFPPDWLMCWYKGSTGHASYIGFNDWEPHLVYGRLYNNQYMHDYFQTKPSPKKGEFNHPCPKPIDWANWIITRVARKKSIMVCDPFMGSGTVGVACKELGHDFIGIEKDAEYFEMAKKRIAGAVRQ